MPVDAQINIPALLKKQLIFFNNLSAKDPLIIKHCTKNNNNNSTNWTKTEQIAKQPIIYFNV